MRKEDFAETVRTPLPYAYDLAAHLTGEPHSSAAGEFAGNQTPPPSEKECGPVGAGRGRRILRNRDRRQPFPVHQLPQQREHLAAGHRVQRPRHQDHHRHRRMTPEVKYP
ncbi:hypothetical protein [Streptomyces sp. NPDC051572]|uniref:hypothetical protein n=1 Tax=unclassified Streptomyces TaxID=2593676 RepID=UPI00344C4F82